MGFYLAAGSGLKADLCFGYGDYCLPFSVKKLFSTGERPLMLVALFLFTF